MDALAEAVHNYVEGRRWDTLVGRAFDMIDPDGREAFAQFLTTHIRGLLRYMEEHGDPRNQYVAMDYHTHEVISDTRVG